MSKKRMNKKVLYGHLSIERESAFRSKLTPELAQEFNEVLDTILAWYAVVLINNTLLRSTDRFRKKK